MLLIKTPFSIELIQPQEILYCRIDENGTSTITLVDRSIIVNHSLKELDMKLFSLGFYRCHAKCIVNIRSIKRYFPKVGEIEMTDGSIIKVAKDKKAQFYKLLLARQSEI